MIDLDDCMTIEGEGDPDEETYFSALQRAINAGAWSFQGSYGRAMMGAIESGRCMLGRSSYRDAYGNRIPSRDEVEGGTKGSRAFVEDAHGEEWAEFVEAIE
jgi:hypothetical protein